MKISVRQFGLVASMLVLVSFSAYATNENGPTINLDYGKGKLSANPVSEFMYFVPLVSKTPVSRWISEQNDQSAQVVSHTKTVKGNSFTVKCELKITGNGSYRNVFNFDDMLQFKKQFFDEGGTIKRMLEYIQFEGESLGCISIKGKIDGGIETVQTVEIDFGYSDESPVLISMYDIECKDGKYNDKDKKSCMLVRVNKLSFERCDENPVMKVDVASVRSAKNKEGFLARFTGQLVNIFMPPMEITQDGNDAMLSFGAALTREDNAFIFPKAENLNGSMVAMSNSRLGLVKP
jgi:hypothetical protein